MIPRWLATRKRLPAEVNRLDADVNRLDQDIASHRRIRAYLTARDLLTGYATWCLSRAAAERRDTTT